MTDIRSVTFGCRLNSVESDMMVALASAAGHDKLTIVNTCAVTAEAVRQARQAIRRLARDEPGREIVVTGCASEIDRERFEAMAEVRRLVPNGLKGLAQTWQRPGQPLPAMAPPLMVQSRTRAFLEVQNGCDHRCTFCVIPFGRGASRSVPIETVIAQAGALVANGTREIVLTGVDLTSYSAGSAAVPVRLGDMVRTLLAAVPDLPRLRLSSIDCIEADPTLLHAIASEPRLMPYWHLSLQSGSDLILKRMKRRHRRAEAIRFCAALRAARPDVVFGADIIVGFPTETEAMFAESLALIEDCGLTHLHVFPFSPRPGTPASRMPRVDPQVTRERAARLRQAGDQALQRHLDAQTGRTLRILMERGGRGRTADFTAVRPSWSAPPGQFVDVLIDANNGKELDGRPA